MKNLISFVKLIALLLANKSASIANIPSYTTKAGKVYKNLKINLNVNTNRLKKEFLERVVAFNTVDFDYKNEPKQPEILIEAYNEVLISAKNALRPMEEKNNYQLGQINAYEFIGDNKAIAYNENMKSVKLFGTFMSGEILEIGEVKSLGKSQKVRYKRMLEKQIGQVIRLPWTLENIQDLNCFGAELNFG